MGNLFQSTSSGVGILKEYYHGPIKSQFNDDVAIWRGAEKGKHKWSGRRVIRPLKLRRNQGVGATSDGGNLPTIGRQTVVQAQIDNKYNYLRFGITGPMMKQSQSDVGSFVRDAAYELTEGYKDLKSDVNRQMSWDGTGDVARLNANVSGSTTVVLKGREDGEAALKFLDVGATVDIYDSGGSLVQSGVQINAITAGGPSSSTATVTMDAVVTASEDDIVVRSTSDEDNEIEGLLTALDGGTSTIYGIDRSTYISYQGNVNDLGGAALSLDELQNSYNDALQRGHGKISAIYSDFDSLRMYQKLLTPDKRYTNTVKGDGGFAKKGEFYLDFNGTPWVADKDCPKRIFMLPPDAITKYINCEMEFADESGAPYIAQSGVDSYEVRIRFFGNLFNAQPSACAVLKDYVSP